MMGPGSLSIGSVKLDLPLILAPMAGVTDLPFRILCREQGAALVCSEMVSAKAITFGSRKTRTLLQSDPAERPFSLQLFGSDPQALGQAARMIDGEDFDILDFNMGCPVPKVVGNGEGSALMLDPKKARAALEALVRNSSRPVTVKIRAGFDEEHKNAPEIARIAEDCGVSAVVVHGRTRQQYYSGRADWDMIRRVKEAVKIPVIGNGDIRSGADALRMMEETGCDGVMAGRGARGNPWIFREIRAAMLGEPIPPRPGREEVVGMILRHCRMNVQYKGEHLGILEMRKQIAWYTAGLPGSSRLREKAFAAESYEDVERLMQVWLKEEYHR